jgi:hypothetical protein
VGQHCQAGSCWNRIATSPSSRSYQVTKGSQSLDLNPKLTMDPLNQRSAEMNEPSKNRNLKVIKRLSSTPVTAVCTYCRREFKAPMSALSRTVDAQVNLQQQFDRHRCQDEDAK